jgi:hypothetical protein
MRCVSCGHGKGKRACPALGGRICAVCCGTKRLVEVRCPADCGYLTSSRIHPPAVVQRQQELDRAMLLPLLQGLSERQARLFLLLAATTARHEHDLLQRLVDADIAEACAALASTLETADRGIVYDHVPASLPARRLMAELQALVADVSRNAGSSIGRDAAIALRRIEHAANMIVAAGVSPGLQELFARVLAPSGSGPDGPLQSPDGLNAPPSLIIP